ncbi:LOG family protein [Tolypocladium ophioglossoides CBS 100239]|uniref:LOG family protein n=1 Tax=Tolypocladium ophioglossoides (strain CBS 100239) TaxID=1163406 RepID=A0A0L0NHU9_TOLOC|nr:LOG family protein [Tolypocladium ophioglossoides CBS 100239]
MTSDSNGTAVAVARNGTAGNDTAANGTAANGTKADGKPRIKICVYCGASAGKSDAHLKMARELAEALAANDADLVYGGGTVGLMGEVAKRLCEIKGPKSVHGIIPEALVEYERDDTYQTVNAKKQIVPEHAKYGQTTVVADMHTRKKLMAEEVFAGAPGSGFIALSGGYGTVEEIFETITWNQLGIHTRGICLLNVDGYWDGIVQWLDKAVEQGFVKEANRDIVVTATSAADAVKALSEYKVSEATFKLKWGSQ